MSLICSPRRPATIFLIFFSSFVNKWTCFSSVFILSSAVCDSDAAFSCQYKKNNNKQQRTCYGHPCMSLNEIVIPFKKRIQYPLTNQCLQWYPHCRKESLVLVETALHEIGCY